jgi:acyl-CoA reductase-like NAD-dependent aldehyde dehydrogenase
MGIAVAKSVHGRLGRSILELGGNNALIVCPSADLEMAAQSIFFGAVGTAASVALPLGASSRTSRLPTNCARNF